jgi:transcriptional regulator with XRE-family HTH domain
LTLGSRNSAFFAVISGYNQYGFGHLTPTLLFVQDIQKKVGANVREWRLKRKLTQDVFAERSGLHRAHVGEIEWGESNVTVQTLKLIADTLKIQNRRPNQRPISLSYAKTIAKSCTLAAHKIVSSEKKEGNCTDRQ